MQTLTCCRYGSGQLPIRHGKTQLCYRSAKGKSSLRAAKKIKIKIIQSTIINADFTISHFGAFKSRLLTDGENEAGVEAVALTIGDENVKGTQGGVEVVGGSL